VKKPATSEILVGGFVLVGVACLAVLSINLGQVEIVGRRGYHVTATFTSTGGLKEGSSVEIAGVDVGRVTGIGLRDNRAVLDLSIDPQVKLQDDAIASIRTRGLIGDKYVAISPGGSDRLIAPGGRLRETEDPIDLEQLISSYIMGKI
jgi:phospholipid/cholesterol/gamma-HCH transport system substrate-binding protein